MRLDELTENSINNTIRFPSDLVDWISVHDYYDGPLSGLVEVGNTLYYAHCVEWPKEYKAARIFALLKLTAKSLAAILANQALFHTDPDNYQKNKDPTPIEGDVVGWFKEWD